MALPMTVGELGLTIWMIASGGKTPSANHFKELTPQPFTT